MARVIEITTPLEKDELLFHKMHATEEVGRLFKYELELVSLKEDVALDEVLGKSITVTLERADGEVRYFNGICSRISEGGKRGRFFTYHATVRPWLWLLTRTKNYRMFQEMSVPDILKEIFDQHSGTANVEVQLTETYTPWVYCVQYNETDFAFVSRLMEHEGIYYYFKHIDGKHTLVIADSYSAHSPCYESEIPFIPPHERVRPEREHVSEWSITREIQPGKYALASYDFEKPSVDLQVRSSIKREHAEAEYEVFEYGGDYVERGDGEMYARTRIEEVQANHERTRGATNARALAPGYLFKLAQHPRSDQNAEYLVVSAEYAIQSGEHEAIDATAAEYACAFTALNSRQPFRAERTTPKPVVQGPQTALVVGPSGEDIYTDKYGRIKVHFYWDRKSNRDDNSSCWIRVSQNWGGKGWGGMFIPHVGQEVIVMFEGGDPDLPLITGRVYNAENMPPVELPGGKTQSIIRDHGANEIKMEGDGGKQSIRMFSPHANTVFKLGAPNEPFQGFFFKTDQEWNEYVQANKAVKTDGDSRVHVEGSEEKSVHGNSNYYLRGNYVCRVDGKQEYSTTGDYITKVYSKNWVTIMGADIDNYLSLQHCTNVGVRTGLMLAAQFSATTGAHYEFRKSYQLFKTPLQKYMAGQEKKQIGEALLKIGREKKKVSGEMEAKANKMLTRATQISGKASGRMSQEASKMLMKASKLEQEASKISKKAGKIIHDGVTTINNALKVSK